MLLEPRMAGRALDRVVERDLDAGLAGARDEALEVGERPQLRMDRRMTAVLRADRPRAPDVATLRRHRVVAPLPVRVPDRVDRRQVHDVEPELRQPGQHLLHTREAAPGTRKELVPGAEARELGVDVDA